jgi:N-acetylglucosaminyldiphosphoundecaprenol N-acetyl-beta-D-mannosaminyltransferase
LTPRTLSLLDVPVHQVTTAGSLSLVQQFMSEDGLHQIATVNPEFIMTAQEDEEFRRVLIQADLCLPDGVGLLLAGRWLGQPFPERVAGSDFVYRLAQLAAENGWRLFLLGAAPGVAEEAAGVFQERYPDLAIAGTYAGSPDQAENEAIVRRINESRSDLLYVAFGAPNQDKWIAHNPLDFVAGRATRAPRWIQKVGLEWLHRLVNEPWRWRRMLALPRFAVKVALAGRGKSADRRTANEE